MARGMPHTHCRFLLLFDNLAEYLARVARSHVGGFPLSANEVHAR